ncbi:MAG: hypothetical protein SGARI_006817 [Bacillariaceae sp.]
MASENNTEKEMNAVTDGMDSLSLGGSTASTQAIQQDNDEDEESNVNETADAERFQQDPIAFIQEQESIISEGEQQIKEAERKIAKSKAAEAAADA